MKTVVVDQMLIEDITNEKIHRVVKIREHALRDIEKYNEVHGNPDDPRETEDEQHYYEDFLHVRKRLNIPRRRE